MSLCSNPAVSRVPLPGTYTHTHTHSTQVHDCGRSALLPQLPRRGGDACYSCGRAPHIQHVDPSPFRLLKKGRRCWQEGACTSLARVP
jgi:hypothetical protein